MPSGFELGNSKLINNYNNSFIGIKKFFPVLLPKKMV